MKEFELYNEVGVEGGITVDLVRNFLNANKTEDITFKIASLGGDLSQGILIHNLIKSHQGYTIAEIVGLTASAATIIAMGCDKIQMDDNALFLIHNGWTSVTGNSYDMQKVAGELQKNDAVMTKIYMEKTGLSNETISSLMKASDWLSPEEAKSYGFVDSIISTGKKIAASISISDAAKMNEILITKLNIKMLKIFGKDKKEASVVHLLALKDGKNLLINAELPAQGVEVSPVGAATLDDGTYELADGRKIVVSGGTITEVTEVAPPAPMMDASVDAIVAAVGTVVADAVATAKDEIRAEMNAALAKISSSHKPPKGGVGDGNKTPAQSVHSKVDAITAGIRKQIEESRKA